MSTTPLSIENVAKAEVLGTQKDQIAPLKSGAIVLTASRLGGTMGNLPMGEV